MEHPLTLDYGFVPGWVFLGILLLGSVPFLHMNYKSRPISFTRFSR